MKEQLELHDAKRDYDISQNKTRYQDEAQSQFRKIQELEGFRLRHHPSSETGENYAEMIKKKKDIINQVRKNYEIE